jgi:hypothetical protein
MNKQHRRNLKAAAMAASDSASTYRDTITEQLDAIVAAVQLALRDAELSQPVFLSMPSRRAARTDGPTAWSGKGP